LIPLLEKGLLKKPENSGACQDCSTLNYMKQLDKKTALQKASSYCAYQERCRVEVQQKLKSWQLNKEDTDWVVEQLETSNFLNEERYARAYVTGKFRTRKWGRVKIRMMLKSNRLDNRVIQNALEEIDEEEYLQTLIELARKKKESVAEKETDSYKIKAKTINYLLNKGFESDLCQQIL